MKILHVFLRFDLIYHNLNKLTDLKIFLGNYFDF